MIGRPAGGCLGWMIVFRTAGFFLFGVSAVGAVTPALDMPAHWQVVSDFNVPAAQVASISQKLGADLASVRNTVYSVNGKRVQINVIVTVNAENAEKLMKTLSSMKVKEALLRKGRTVYEFVGPNDVLPLIKEGRDHLASLK
ncbi:MAG: hypothetical protein ACOC23_08645 [Thermodesulfobacteriota bacterium]